MEKQVILSKIKRTLSRYRNSFAALQEAQFDKSERELKKLIDQDESEADIYPVPTFVLSILIWFFILCFPLLLILDPTASIGSVITIKSVTAYYVPLVATMVTFFANQRILVPKGLFKRRYALFFVGNALLIFLAIFSREVFSFLVERTPTDTIGDFFREYCFRDARGHFGIWTVLFFLIVWAMVCLVSFLTNVVLKLIVRAFVIREKKQMSLEYELDFLKHQLSPHFLFNTLNNIISLIRIDPTLAENSISKLSQLLRMMVYQTADKFITIEEDVSILQKYAELERLRLDENFDLVFDVKLEDSHRQVEPLLAMPLMENAMKHCVNPEGKSFAHIKITQLGDELTFESENSNFPRKHQPKASGLGLPTFKKRLELMYGGRYTYENKVENNIYKCTLKIILK